MKYDVINSGKLVKLASLITSREISDSNVIQIFDAEGKLIAKGHWYQDQVLDQCKAWGTVTKAGTGLTISFQLA